MPSPDPLWPPFLDNTRSGEPVFYVHAPDYTEFSSGVKCLHLLCDRLNRLGYEAYTTGRMSNGKLRTPAPTVSLMNAHKEAGRLQIVVYPEVVMGNPLLVPNVVRFLLNVPNNFFPVWFGRKYADEFYVHYTPEFAIPWVASERLHIATVNRELFYPPPDGVEERDRFLVYSHRYKNPALEVIPEWCKPYDIVSMESPRTPAELGELYRRARGLILFERTAASLEALLCGCPVIYAPGFGLTEIPRAHANYYNFGVSWNFAEDEYRRSLANVAFVARVYSADQILDAQALEATVRNLVSYFAARNSGAAAPDLSVLMQLARNDGDQGRFSDAILKYNALLEACPDHVEAYFRIAIALLGINWPEVALEMLLRGEAHLATLPNDRMLNRIRARYFGKMEEVCRLAGKLELADTYKRRAGEHAAVPLSG
jgi:hypothetical protein